MRNKEIATLFKTIADSYLTLSEIYSSSEDDFPSMEESPSVAVESSTEEEPTPGTEAKSKTYTKEEVRAMLAQKAKADDGIYKSEVKAIVAKYSENGTLTKVPEDKYSELMAKLEVVGNA